MFDKEQIRSSFDLVSFVGNLTDLKMRGGEWWGCCPLHEEKTPSFHIHRDGEQWYCQGCGAGGDSFDFVAKSCNLDVNRDFSRVCEIMGGEEYHITTAEKTRRAEIPKTPIAKPVSNENMQVIFQDGKRFELRKVYQYGEKLIKCRYESNNDKTFRWYWSDNKSWNYGKGGMTNGLYWAKPEQPISDVVFIAEGEKSADAVAQCGFICVSASDGGDETAEKWRSDYTQELAGLDVVVLNDDDCLKEVNKGKLYADNVAFKIQDVVNSVKRVDINDILPNEEQIDGYDIADIVAKIGVNDTRERLNEVANAEVVENSVEIVETKVNSSNEELVAVITTAVDEVMKTGEIQFDTLENIGKISKKTGVGKREIKAKIKNLVDERRENAHNTIVVNNQESQMVVLNNETFDITDTGFYIDNGQILDSHGNVVLPHLCVYYALVYDVEEGTSRDMLAYNTLTEPNSINFVTVAADEIRSSQKLVGALSKHEIDITTEFSQEFIRYLQQMRIKQGVNTRKIKEINRIGWYNDFLLPYENKEAGVVIRQKTNDYKKAAAYGSTSGDKQKSLDMIKEVIEEIAISPIIIGSMVSSLFMERAGRKGQTHVLNISGISGKGKSVLIKTLYSMFGDSVNSDDMYAGSDATLGSSQNNAGYLRNFPLYLDDPMQTGKDDQKTAGQKIYSLVSGSGRERLNRNGESRKSEEWYSNVLYTNETPLYSTNESLKGGVLSRILDIELEQEISQDKVNKWLVGTAKKNYGHFGKDFAEMIRSIDNDTINGMIQHEYEIFEKIGIDRKRGNTSACISVGWVIACMVFGIDKAFPYNVVLKNVTNAGAISDGDRAWVVFEAWLDGNIEKFRQRIDRFDVLWGSLDYCGDYKVVNIQISKLKEICNQLNIPRESMLRHCAENNLIVIRDGKPTRKVRVKNDKVTVVSFYREWDLPQTREEEYSTNSYENPMNEVY